MKVRRCGHPWIGRQCRICANAARKKRRDEKRGGPAIAGRPPKRFCPAGHDKDLPGGSYWSVGRYKVKKFKKRQCALCHTERDGIYRLIKKLNPEPKKAAQFRARTLKDFCHRGHPMTPDNVYVHETRHGRKQRECRMCRRHRKEEYQLESAAVLREVEKMLALPIRRLHEPAIFARKQLN